MLHLSVSLATIVAFGCGDDTTPTDASASDGAARDAAPHDAAAADGAISDGSAPDAAVSDGAVGDGASADASIDAGPTSCAGDPCAHGGRCVPAGEDFSCECTDAWQGSTCQTEVALLSYIVVTDTSSSIDAGICSITPESQVNDIELTDLCPDGSGGSLAPCEAPGISLREAICAANNTPGPHTLVLSSETYTVDTIDNDWLGPTGLPPITSEITILGNGATIARPDTAPNMRLFWVPGASTAASEASIEAGDLTLDRLTLRGGHFVGGRGGDAGPTSDPLGAGGGGGGGAGMGGAIFNEGTTTLREVLLTDNLAEGGPGGRQSDVLGGPTIPAQATGGGGGSLRGDGGDGGETTAGTGAPGAGNGGVVSSTGFNGAFGGGGGGGGFDAFIGGSAGFGAGAGGVSAGGLSGGGAGGRGLGGAVFNYLGLLRVESSTFAENRVITGCHGDQVNMSGDCVTARPAWSSGAGVYNLNGSVVLRGVTFARNESEGIDATGAIDFETIGDVGGGGVLVTQPAMVDLGWSIFASSGPGVVSFLSRSSSLMGMGSLASSASAPSGTPLAGLLEVRSMSGSFLAARGGPTETTQVPVPRSASPCVGLDGGPLLTDQRGQARGANCRPGAFEDPPTCSGDGECAGSCIMGLCAAPSRCPGPRCAFACTGESVCANGGNCSLRGCECPPGFSGPRCATLMDCAPEPTLDQGAVCEAAIDLGLLSDTAQMTTASGTIPPGSSRTIWYRVRADDTPDTSCDNFHFRARITENPDSVYRLEGRRRDCADSGYLLRGNLPTVRPRIMSTDYTWAQDFSTRDPGSSFTAGQCPCSTVCNSPQCRGDRDPLTDCRGDCDQVACCRAMPNGCCGDAAPNSGAASCEDDSSDFFIGVRRVDPDPGGSCASFTLELSNGVYDTF